MDLRELTKQYGQQRILDRFSFSLPETGTICLYGPSGCGKTTLLRLLAGLEKPDGGSVSTPGESRISVVFQEDRLLPWSTAAENIRIVNPCVQPDILLRQMGLSEAADKYPAELSGGMRQRVAIARALHYGGDILLLDEPLKGLDTALKKKLYELVLPLFEKKLVLLVTHDAQEAAVLADTVLFLRGIPLSLEKRLDFPIPAQQRTQSQHGEYRARIEKAGQ